MGWKDELKQRPMGRTAKLDIVDDDESLRFTTQTTAQNLNGMTAEWTVSG